MSELGIIVSAMVPVLVVTGLGALLRRVGWLREAADGSLLTLAVNVLTPCLIFDKVLASRSLADPRNVLWGPLSGFVISVLSIGASLLAAQLLRRRPVALDSSEAAQVEAQQRSRRSFALATGLQNYGYFPLPLALSLYGDETAAVLFAHNLGVEVALWTVGIAVLARASWRGAAKRLLSAPVLSILCATALNLVLPRDAVPAAVRGSIGMIGAAAVPVGLLLIGATMADHGRQVFGRGSARVVLLACALRLGALPTLYWAARLVLTPTAELSHVFALQAAMPAAVMPIVLSKHYGGDSLTALRVVFGTTLGSLVTLPLWIHFMSGS
ncbi:MAG TPA: AEC family transporter [Polyangiaceae bacterium]|nr:AEC family transporter [Polyangiaceae bacterium]